MDNGMKQKENIQKISIAQEKLTILLFQVVKELRQENLEDIWALRLDRGALFILPIIYTLSVIIFVLNNQD